jgi:2-polyprenyl-3-methyl-5-hydroxy-6-metoxy-1,4-benzoquinol methylase
LKLFDRTLEELARESRSADDPNREFWIRDSISTATVKLRSLDFILRRQAGQDAGDGVTLLDVGTQTGALAVFAKKLGINVAAVDLDYFAEKFAAASRNHGVDYRCCNVTTEALPFADGSFDYVTYLDVIEHHAHSPKRVMTEIHRVLKPGGCVIISTPNQASIYNRLALLAGRSITDPLPYFFETTAEMTPYPGHHREYVRAELLYVLDRTNFDIVESRVIDESLRPELLVVSRENGSLPGRLWKHKKALAAAALGHVWSGMGVPWGRILWVVGRKRK